MPLYDYSCAKCGEITDIWAKCHEMIMPCPKCGAMMNRLISAPHIICDIEPYFDENLADARKAPQGTYVTSRQDRKRKMKKLGLTEIG